MIRRNWKKLLPLIFGRQQNGPSAPVVAAAVSSMHIHDHLDDTSIDEQLTVAAERNDVDEIKRLQGIGADIDYMADVTLGSGTIIIGPKGLSQPKSLTTPLMVALYKGAFEAALYLAQSGANATYGRKTEDDRVYKPLDFILSDHVPESAQAHISREDLLNGPGAVTPAQRQKNYQTDLYTPQQRLQLFEAIVASSQNPHDLLSENTLDNALNWGRAEVIPKLVEIGVSITGKDFVRAASPIHRRHAAIPMMEALLPYVKNVNVTDGSSINAGHNTARNHDLAAFQWLEQRGLVRHALARTSISTYAHCVATDSWAEQDKDKDEQIAFAKYLIEQDYPIDTKDEFNNYTPADVAFDEKCIEVGIIYLNAGAEPKPQYLEKAFDAFHFGKTSAKTLIELINAFDKSGSFGPEAKKVANDSLIRTAAWDEKHIAGLVTVFLALTKKELTSSSGGQSLFELNETQAIEILRESVDHYNEQQRSEPNL